MRILVAGGAGFLGAHLCRHLLDAGNSVICLDDLSTGLMSNIETLTTRKDFCFKKGCVTVEHDLNVNQIYNLACPASPKFYQSDPIRTAATAGFGAFRLLEMGARCNATVLQASTSEVYGMPHTSPQDEDYWGNVNPIGHRACYDEGKRYAEALCSAFHQRGLQKVKIARIFNTYGPGMRIDDGRAISNFIVNALKNQAILIDGDGTQTRSFCYVTDLIGGLYSFMESDFAGMGPINLGNDYEISMVDLARKILMLTGSRSRLSFGTPRPDDPIRRKPAIVRASNVLGWKPTVGLDKGLALTISHYEKVLRQGHRAEHGSEPK